MSQTVFGAQAVVTTLNRAFNNSSPANAVFTNQVATAGTTEQSQASFALQFGNSFAGLTDAALAARVLGNLGVLPNAELEAAVTQYFADTGLAARGLVVLQLGQILSTLETAPAPQDIFNAAAAAWNTEVEKSFVYSSTASNTTPYNGDFPTTPVDAGATFTLTTGIDNIISTGGNDTIIGDNSGTVATATAGDQVAGGAGNDVFKLFVGATQAVDAITLPQMSAVETLYIKGGVLTNAATANYSTVSGLTAVELDSPAALVNGTNFNVKTSATQAVTLTNVNTAAAGTAKVTLSDATSLTVNNVGASTTDSGVVQIDVANATATSATITASVAASKVTLLNGSAKLETLNIAGDKNLTLVESLAGVKTINASTATGNVSVDTSGATLAAAFKFTGGTGNDTLKLTQASLEAITAGTQLDGGTAGIDTLSVVAAANLTFNAAATKVVNAATGFDVLGLGGATTSVVDASTLTTIKSFAVGAGTNTISKVGIGSSLTIGAATTTTTVSGAVGVNDLTVNIGTAASTTKITNGALDITGLQNVTINTAIKAGVTGQDHTLGTLTNSDNSVFTIKGNGDFTFALAAATVTGSKVDGSAATGILSITGNSATLDGTKASLGDILIGGSAADTLITGANSTVLTGNGGNDTFDVKLAVSNASTPITTVTDFTKGDKLLVKATAAILEKVDLSGLAAGKTDLEVITALATAASTAVNDVAWGTYNGNTYVFNENATAGAITATDIAVKLVGTLDLSTSAIASGVVTFA